MSDHIDCDPSQLYNFDIIIHLPFDLDHANEAFIESIEMDEDAFYDLLKEHRKRKKGNKIDELIKQYSDYLANQLIVGMVAPYLSSNLDLSSVRQSQVYLWNEYAVVLRFNSKQTLRNLDSGILQASEVINTDIICFDITSEEVQRYCEGEYDTGTFSNGDNIEEYKEYCRKFAKSLEESLTDEDYSLVPIPKEYLVLKPRRKDMSRYLINCDRNATRGEWIAEEDIHSVTPFLNFIKADDGEDYVDIDSETGFKVIEFNDGGFIENDGEVTFHFNAVVNIDLEGNPEFATALEASENCVYVDLGFKKDGEEIEYAFEPTEDAEIELEEA